MIPTCTTGDMADMAETKKDKAIELPFEKPDSNSPVRQVLNALQTASRGAFRCRPGNLQTPQIQMTLHLLWKWRTFLQG